MGRSIFFYSWLLLSLFVRFRVWSLFGDAFLYVLSNFTIISLGKRDIVALFLLFFFACHVDLIVFSIFHNVRLACLTVSLVCECGISWSYLVTPIYQPS